ncbi:hypothetical protein [Mucilaginibacter paludis]|uniref:Uncharacterized protein n=1 Tax=Mucilaginibacter paludis DSM 18603 TaxID=714943 RepID=H1Y444_9SPHI|nr:hypothetical protein [Mucilaginibacter paludis]EHQ24780.1 hypothetical protein Mucpa_0588 [Mucilaginibacter paludis DSM 18603]
MENTIHPHSNLLKITDQQWINLVELLTENVLALNSRTLSSVEIMYRADGHFPVYLFRLTSTLEDPEDQDLMPQVSGFSFGYDTDIDDEVYIQPLSPDGYWEKFLDDIGITHIFTTNNVGMKKLYKFLSEDLKIWNDEVPAQIIIPEPNVWRTLLVEQQIK